MSCNLLVYRQTATYPHVLKYFSFHSKVLCVCVWFRIRNIPWKPRYAEPFVTLLENHLIKVYEQRSPKKWEYHHKLFTFSASVTDVQHNEVIIKKIKDKGDEEQVE